MAAFGAFADVGMYIKGALGYGYRVRDWGEWTYTYQEIDYTTSLDTLPTVSYLFNIVPTFGIIPWQNSGNVFLDGLTFEFSLDLGFGKAITSTTILAGNIEASSVVINPGAMAVFHYGVGPGRRIVPFGGVGVSVPIVIIGDLGDMEGVDSSVKAGFNVNLLVGVGYAVTEKVMPLIEWGIGFGTGWSWQVRAGIAYKFGGGSGNPPPPPAEE